MRNAAFALVITIFLSGCVGTQFASNTSDSLLVLLFEDYNGTKRTLEEFSGTPIVVNSWAGWCSFCKKELVDFATVQREMGDAVTIVVINRGESVEKAKRFSQEAGDTDGLVFWVDEDDTFYRAIGGFSMPETLFINAQGDITFHKRGPMDADEIRQRVHELLQPR